MARFFQRSPWGTIVITVLSIIVLVWRSAAGDDSPRRHSGDTAPKSAGGRLESDALITATIRRLENLNSISAEISLKMTVFGENFTGTGHYEELAPEKHARQGVLDTSVMPTKFRLHLEIPAPGAAAIDHQVEDNILEIVCDGRSVWNYTSIEGEKKLTEINLTEMVGILGQLSRNEQRLLQQRGIVLPSPVGSFPALGGIAGTLQSLRYWYQFDPTPQVSYFNAGDLPVWKLTGRMRSDILATLRRKVTREEDRHRDLEANLPDAVELYIGQKTLFPLRIAYFSYGSEEQRSQARPLMTLDFPHTCENTSTITSNNFVYVPKINSVRVTKDYLRDLIPEIEF